MGKLSRIEDIEARQADAAAGQVEPAQALKPEQPEPEAPVTEPEPAPQPEPEAPVTEPVPAPQPEQTAQQRQRRSQADQEEDFHGISTAEPLGLGHTVLRAAAVIVFLCAVAFVLNYWFHFV